jgi:hypothetical protein
MFNTKTGPTDPLKQIVPDELVNEAFKGTEFGKTPYREIMSQGLLKSACGFADGFTAESILVELGLLKIGSNQKRILTRSGKDYLFECFANK